MIISDDFVIKCDFCGREYEISPDVSCCGQDSDLIDITGGFNPFHQRSEN